jgi:hypothetical protein
VGGSALVLAGVGQRAPRFMDRIGRTVLARGHQRNEPARGRPSNLHQPGFDGSVRGDHPRQWIRPSLYTRWNLVRPSAVAVAAVAVLGLAAWSALRST